MLGMFLLTGCDKDEEGDPNDYKLIEQGNTVFVINEGAFMNENSSLSYIDKTKNNIDNDFFYDVNDRLLGDVFQSMEIINNEGYLVINNSGVVEVVDHKTIELKTTIDGFNSPRYILPVDESTAYVSDMFEGCIWVVDLDDHTIESEIEFPGGWSEAMVKIDDNVFVTAPNVNKVYVIDPTSHSITGSLEVLPQPNSLVTDKDGSLWVLSGGEFDFETGEQIEPGGLTEINAQTIEKIQQYSFPEDGISYSNLTIDESGKDLYYIGGGIWNMSIDDQELAGEPLIESQGENFYGIGVSPQTGNLYVGDAIDFDQRGVVLKYTSAGDKIDSYDAGVAPGGFLFY